jgi:hypothetical protein
MIFRCQKCGARWLDASECLRCSADQEATQHRCMQCGTEFLARPDCPPICPDCYLVRTQLLTTPYAALP